MKEKIIFVLLVIAILIMIIIALEFIISANDLYNFEKCYEINFQDEKCIKYKNY